MITHQDRRIILTMTFVLCALVIAVSVAGLFVPGTYAAETPNWTAQAFGQDIFDLFLVVPLLIITAVFIAKKSRTALLVWSGAVLYVLYTFVIYCFAVHFNSLFLLYCFILGLSFYSFVYFLLSQTRQPVTESFGGNEPAKLVSTYLIAVACVFYLLWLSDVVPNMIANATPQSIIDTGLLTNPVHALDLAIILPGFFVIGLLLLRRKPLGSLLAPTALVFMILMDITIGGLNIIMQIRGLEGSYVIAAVMAVLGLVSVILLVSYIKGIESSEKKT